VDSVAFCPRNHSKNKKTRTAKTGPGYSTSALAVFDLGFWPGARKLGLTYSIKSAPENYTLKMAMESFAIAARWPACRLAAWLGAIFQKKSPLRKRA